MSFLRGTGGLYLFDGSHAGYRADLYINREQADLHWQAAAAVDPSFITCMLGANDMAGNFDVPIPPEEWAANLATLVETALASCPNAGFYFFHWTERYEDHDTPDKVHQFEEAAWRAIGSHPRVSFRVLTDLLPSGHDDSLRWHAFDGNDHVHPNAFGWTYLAHQLARTI
ncbi:SGNH/GDSL hydrolase family protein [Microlunatus sp. Y2014]|uniref:SGNH/GDSL hydrolase family protein n=1 Tax=Microlunatus sp. Y2014 TaxID=3418488 RepID=UPI003DA76624